MRIISILRAGTLALLLTAAVGSIGAAYADQVATQSQSQSQQAGSTGPYDGADYQAAKHAFY